MDFDAMLVSVLVPLGVCVVLPVMIVWLVMRWRINSDNKRSDVLIEAIRNNCDVDVDRMIELLAKKPKSDFKVMTNLLIWGYALSLVGLATLIYWIVTFCMGNEEFEGLYFALLCFAVGIAILFGANRYKKLIDIKKQSFEE